jgi:hypothetical protein
MAAINNKDNLMNKIKLSAIFIISLIVCLVYYLQKDILIPINCTIMIIDTDYTINKTLTV